VIWWCHESLSGDLLGRRQVHWTYVKILRGGLNGVEAVVIELRDRKSGNEKFVTRSVDIDALESQCTI
jgi:hypothetical protein